jgi:hypothetical protein
LRSCATKRMTLERDFQTISADFRETSLLAIRYDTWNVARSFLP